MATLSTKIKMYVKDNGKVWQDEKKNYVLINNGDGAGDIIESWNVSGLTQPTDEQLDTYNSTGDTFEANVEIIRTRKSLYGTTAKQLEYIVENGIDSFIAKQNQIKTDNPKE